MVLLLGRRPVGPGRSPSEFAGSVGVPASTVRYYEWVGLMSEPARTVSGYRDYDDEAASRLLFITRARRMGPSCEQITSLLPIWAGTNCGAAQDR
jgi:DNA-binding transcriptional MerR regulator